MIDLRAIIEPLIDARSLNGCWRWKGYIRPTGYGGITIKAIDRRKSQSAHRLAYMAFIGKIPKKKWILHECDNKWCVNPFHIGPGTASQNNMDSVKKGRRKFDWQRRFPERVPRGKNHWTVRHPELIVRGKDHWATKHPELMSHGDEHWTRKHPEWKAKAKYVRGESAPRVKLNDKKVNRIRKLKIQGELNKTIALRFNISSSQVGKIVTRKQWRHLQ